MSTNHPPLININVFYKALASHDWHYMRSDDSRAYEKGQKSQDALIQVAETRGPEFLELYKAWSLKSHVGGAYPPYRGLDIKHNNPKYEIYVEGTDRLIDVQPSFFECVQIIDLYMDSTVKAVSIHQPFTDYLDQLVNPDQQPLDTNVIDAKERFNGK